MNPATRRVDSPLDRSSPGLTVEAITDAASLATLRETWNGLVEQTGIDHPFLRHEWVGTWWECFGGKKALHVLLVREAGEPIALAPLMLGRARLLGVPVRTLEFLWNGHVPRFDIIVARKPDEAYRAIWRHVARRRDLWDVLKLPELVLGSRTLLDLPQLASADGFFAGVWASTESPYVPRQVSWDAYERELSRKHRSNLRNRFKRLSALGRVELQVVNRPEDVGAAVDDALRIEASGWKGRAGTAIACRPDTEAFYTRLAEKAAARGWLSLQFLTVGGHRVAFQYNLTYRNRNYLLKAGHDPEYAKYGPQHLLCSLALKDAFLRGIEEYDFLGACEEWKMSWTRKVRRQAWVFVFPRDLRGSVLYALKCRIVPAIRRTRLYRRLRDLDLFQRW
jgi:CelD/BcsL family acetyltransferase involved in cellulose biosynthesis